MRMRMKIKMKWERQIIGILGVHCKTNAKCSLAHRTSSFFIWNAKDWVLFMCTLYNYKLILKQFCIQLFIVSWSFFVYSCSFNSSVDLLAGKVFFYSFYHFTFRLRSAHKAIFITFHERDKKKNARKSFHRWKQNENCLKIISQMKNVMK